MIDERVYDPYRMLEWWGLRETGGSLKDPTKKSNGGKASEDDEEAAMIYVQTTPNFRVARPVLAHVHIEGLPLCDFVVRGPGERLTPALLRRSWWQLVGIRENLIAEAIYTGFVEILIHQLDTVAFTPPSKLPKIVEEHEGPVTEREKDLIESLRNNKKYA